MGSKCRLSSGASSRPPLRHRRLETAETSMMLEIAAWLIGSHSGAASPPFAIRYILPGGDLFSHSVTRAVSWALGRFTSVFGMGTGGATPLEPPESRGVIMRHRRWFDKGVRHPFIPGSKGANCRLCYTFCGCSHFRKVPYPDGTLLGMSGIQRTRAVSSAGRAPDF